MLIKYWPDIWINSFVCRKDKRAPAVKEREASGKISANKKAAIDKRHAAINSSKQKARDRVKNPVAQYDLWGGIIEHLIIYLLD